MTQNRLLTLDEVLALPKGETAFVETRKKIGLNAEGVMRRAVLTHKKGHENNALCRDYLYWDLDEPRSFSVDYRVWLREPTAEELAANPWPTPIAEV